MESQNQFKVRCMRPDEAERVAKLVRDLQELQRMKHCPRLPTGDDLQRELVRRNSQTGELYANNNGTYTAVAVDLSRLKEPNKAYIVGYLIYSQAFSLIDGRHFWMNSFFLEEEYRRHGLGGKLMEYMRLHALSSGNKRVDIPFMNNNTIGRKFYANFGAYLVNDEYQIMGKRLA